MLAQYADSIGCHFHRQTITSVPVAVLSLDTTIGYVRLNLYESPGSGRDAVGLAPLWDHQRAGIQLFKCLMPGS